MTVKKAKKKPTNRVGVSTDFLVQTLASIQSALISIDKQSTAQTEALVGVSENINIVAEMMKHFHEQNIRDGEKINSLEFKIQVLHSDLQLLNNDSDIKEIKFAIQKAEANLSELKTIKQVKDNFERDKDIEKGQWNFVTFIKDLVSGLNNVKTILMVVLIIIMLIASLIYGPSVIQIFLDILKKLTL